LADFLPVATENDLPANIPDGGAIPVDAAVSALADTLADLADTDPTNVRIGAITSISDPLSQNRVQTSITGTSWVSRTADASLRVGDRVWLLQQGPQFIVGGRLSGTDAFTPIGALMPYAGSSSVVPTGWLACDGTAVNRTTYAALFAVIGTIYGAGNGSTTFNLPNLVNRIPVGSGSSYTRGQTGGAATVTLTESQLASHNHSLSGSASSAGSHSHSGSADSNGDHSHSGDGAVGNRSDLLAGGGTNAATNSGTGSTGSAGGHGHSISIGSGGDHSHSLSGSVGDAGSDSSHENMPPFVAMPYIIRAL
jgi:microcystin-dependent protein